MAGERTTTLPPSSSSIQRKSCVTNLQQPLLAGADWASPTSRLPHGPGPSTPSSPHSHNSTPSPPQAVNRGGGITAAAGGEAGGTGNGATLAWVSGFNFALLYTL